MRKLIEFIRTFRLELLYIVLVTLVFGLMVAGERVVFSQYIYLILLSISIHIFGYEINDLTDFKYDKDNPRHVKRSSLIKGLYSRKWFWIIILIQLPLVFLWFYLLNGSVETIIIACISILFLGLYNFFGKRAGRWIYLVDLFFPLSMVCLFLAAFSFAQPISQISWSEILLMVSLFLNMFLANSIASGFYNLEYDVKSGASTFVGQLGNKAAAYDLSITKTTRIIAHATYLLNIPVLVMQLYLNGASWWAYLIVLLFLFFGWTHFLVLLSIKNLEEMARFDPFTWLVYSFYAATVAWLFYLPDIYWVVIVLNLLYPFVINRKGHYGFSTFRASWKVLRS